MKFIRVLKANENKGKRTFYLYAGYYELYLTDHKLSEPYMYQDENTDLNQLINDNISIVNDDGEMENPNAKFTDEDSIVIDKSILDEINKTDMFSGYADRYSDAISDAEYDGNTEEDISTSYNIVDLSDKYAD